MLIEATKHPIRYTMRNGQEVRLVPGSPMEIPEAQARVLLAKAPDRVRLVPCPLTIGQTIEWCSPLFGNLRGAVLLIEGDSILVDHPTIGEPAWICRAWVITTEVQR
jgi:hypothetical protein